MGSRDVAQKSRTMETFMFIRNLPQRLVHRFKPLAHFIQAKLSAAADKAAQRSPNMQQIRDDQGRLKGLIGNALRLGSAPDAAVLALHDSYAEQLAYMRLELGEQETAFALKIVELDAAFPEPPAPLPEPPAPKPPQTYHLIGDLLGGQGPKSSLH
jgi:hypothetical protein